MTFDPTAATWLNEPTTAAVTPERVSITTDPGSDSWQRTYYGFRNDNAHALLLEVAENFTLTVHVRFEYRTRFDQCGLAIYEESDHWFKASVEYERPELSRLGSVVTNGGYSDWATVDIETPREIWYRLSRRGPDFLLERALGAPGTDERDAADAPREGASTELSFRQMRVFHLASLGETTTEMGRANPPLPPERPVHVGLYACSPLEGSFTAEFDSFVMEPCRWEAHAE